MNTDMERSKFIEAGYAYIPLKLFSKDALVQAWSTKSPLTQWRNTSDGLNPVNEPVRLGLFSEVTK